MLFFRVKILQSTPIIIPFITYYHFVLSYYFICSLCFLYSQPQTNDKCITRFATEMTIPPQTRRWVSFKLSRVVLI